MRWMHHPLRADATVKYIEPGLLLLSEVKRTSDIFLPKRWVEAMLSGHSSARAAMSVRRFLDSRPPHYPVALRRMVLASADYLFRAAVVPRLLQSEQPESAHETARMAAGPSVYKWPQA